MITYSKIAFSPIAFKLLFIIIIINFSCFSNHKRTEAVTLNSETLKKDFIVLRKTLEEGHPGLYWYTGKPAMDRFFDSTYSLLNHGMTGTAFFKLLLPVIAKIKCVHTNIRLPIDTQHHARFNKLLPFNFYCVAGKLFITKDFSDAKHAGAEILSVNNIPTKQIFGILLQSLPADGYNETFKYQLLSKGAFREGYALYFGEPDTFKINATDANQKNPIVFTVKPKAITELIPDQQPFPTKPLELGFRNEAKTAILELNTFEMNSLKWKDTLLKIFKSIRENNSKNLIIDLRKNGGGNNDNVSALFSFIASEPFKHLKRAESNPQKFTYLQYFKNQESFNKQVGIPDVTGKILMNSRYAGTSIKEPETENTFRGPVILLTSGITTSAASEFAAICHFTKRAKIVGEETGGCYYGATGGNFINLKLPASGLEVRIPTNRIFTAVNEDYSHQPRGRGTFPDREIIPTVNDIITRKDVQLEFVLKILKN